MKKIRRLADFFIVHMCRNAGLVRRYSDGLYIRRLVYMLQPVGISGNDQ